MKKTLFFVILVFFGTSSIAQEKLDSLWSLWSQKYLADTTRLKAISEITEAVVRNNPDSGYVLAWLMLDLATDKCFKNYQADAHFLQGRSYSYLPNYSEALISYEKSIALNEQIGDRAGKALTMKNTTGLNEYQGKYYLAIDYYNRAMSIYDEIGDTELRAGVSKVLGHWYFMLRVDGNQGFYFGVMEVL